MMQQFQCDPPRMTCKTQSESQDSTAEQLPFDQRWRNHSTAVCRHWVATRHRIATHQRIATHYCRTHCLDAAVAMHKAAQNEQESTAKRTPASVARAWANFSPQRKLRLPKKKVLCKSQDTNRIHDAAVPMRSAKNDLQNTIRIARQYCRAATFRPALMQSFHCGLQTLSWNAP